MGRIAQHYVEIGAKVDGLQKGLQKSQDQFEKFSNTITRIGAALGIAFGATEIVNFGKEAIKLASQMEGVEAAFTRIKGPQIMAELRDSVKGTVSELELMKRAVQARNFDIPLKDLGSLFKFATKRAQETGESVDYLVNSIVLGIGRKSPLILDNLGISAVRLRQELKGAGVESTTVGDIAAAVGKIASQEMAKAGDIIETTAIKTERATAKLKDLKAELGELLTPAVGAGQTLWSKILDGILTRVRLINFELKKVPEGAEGPFTQEQMLESFLSGKFPKKEISGTGGKDIFYDFQKFADTGGDIDETFAIINDALGESRTSFDRYIDSLNEYVEGIGPAVDEGLISNTENLYEFYSAANMWQQEMLMNFQNVSDYLTNFFEGFAQAFTSGENVLQQFADYFKKWAAGIIAQITAIALAATVLSIITGGSFKGIFGEIFGGSGIGKLFGGFGKLGGLSGGGISSVLSGEDIYFAYNEYSRKNVR